MSTALHFQERLDLQALTRFTISSRIFGEDRRILSWVDPSGTGYPYDECTALYARLYAWLGRAQDAMALTDVLEDRLAAQGWLGRDGIGYAFDSSLCLDAIASPLPLTKQVAFWLTTGTACTQVTRPGWWSQSYGAHLLKCLPPLARQGRANIALAIADDLVDRCFCEGRFSIHGDSGVTYTHSHCYAMEGLLGLNTHNDVLYEAAEWLAGQVLPNGALPAWVHNDGTYPTVTAYPSDIVAQAVRLFAAIDARRYQPEIERGLHRLAVMQDPVTGGIRYTEASSHINTWVSAFAVQACGWVSETPSARDIRWLV